MSERVKLYKVVERDRWAEAFLAVVEADKTERQYRMCLPTDDSQDSQRIRKAFGPKAVIHHQEADERRIAETARYAIHLAENWLARTRDELYRALRELEAWKREFASVKASLSTGAAE